MSKQHSHRPNHNETSRVRTLFEDYLREFVLTAVYGGMMTVLYFYLLASDALSVVPESSLLLHTLSGICLLLGASVVAALVGYWRTSKLTRALAFRYRYIPVALLGLFWTLLLKLSVSGAI